MYYGSGTVDSPLARLLYYITRRAIARLPPVRSVRQPPTAAMTSWPSSWKYDVTSKIRLVCRCVFCLKNNPAEFYPDPIWNSKSLRLSVQELISGCCSLVQCHLVVCYCCSCWGDLFKKPKAPSYQNGSRWNLAGMFFTPWVTSFRTANCCAAT